MEVTVAEYLKQRLEERCLDRLFAIAGNYSAPFLDTILEDTDLAYSANRKELNGYE